MYLSPHGSYGFGWMYWSDETTGVDLKGSEDQRVHGMPVCLHQHVWDGTRYHISLISNTYCSKPLGDLEANVLYFFDVFVSLLKMIFLLSTIINHQLKPPFWGEYFFICKSFRERSLPPSKVGSLFASWLDTRAPGRTTRGAGLKSSREGS